MAFFFSLRPYNALGLIKPELNDTELGHVHFAQGLASILCLNCSLPRAIELREHMGCVTLEHWSLDKQIINNQKVIQSDIKTGHLSDYTAFKTTPAKDLEIYVEQILACILTLRKSYLIYNREF